MHTLERPAHSNPNLPEPADERPYAATIGGALSRAARELTNAGVSEPRLDAELLLAYVLAWDRSREDMEFRLKLRDHRLEAVREQRIFNLTHPEAPLTEWGRRFGMFVRERAAGRPTAYWLEAVEFMGLQFYVNRYVLIPRPETETLVETALGLLEKTPHPFVLDVGTGSGCVGLSIATFKPGAVVWALDISPHALRVARKNASWLHVRDRVHWKRADFTALDPSQPITDASGAVAPPFDLIVSNPPYVAPEEAPTLSQEVLREPKEAVFADDGGFAVINALFAKSRTLLKHQGRLVMELGYTQSTEAIRRAQAAGWQDVEVLPDLAGIPRVLVARNG
ncbi:MAG TPA: peptide chain release factor N(5)-glutamine methyltransferase [Armatimonadota bacterium]|jgi:release factor glutamine methyltransferase